MKGLQKAFISPDEQIFLMVISAARFDGLDPDQIEDGGSVGMASPSESQKKELLQAQNERVWRNSTKRQPHLIYLGVVRAIIRISLTVTLTCCSGTMATAADDLYRAQAIVTGQGEANRIIGFASCLEDVLIKVSGAQKLAGDRRLAAYKSNAKDSSGHLAITTKCPALRLATSRVPAIGHTI